VNGAFSVSAWYGGRWDESQVAAWASDLRRRLNGPVSFGLLFLTPTWSTRLPGLLEVVQLHAHVPLLAGCTTSAAIAGAQELEGRGGFALGLYHLPGAEVQAVHVRQGDVEGVTGPEQWISRVGVPRESARGWLAFLDPLTMDVDAWLKSWNAAYPGVPIIGGLAGADFRHERTLVFLNQSVFEEGGVLLSLGGAVELVGRVAQGCTPIGETWTLTRVEQNLIHRIANRPAYEVLLQTVQGLPPDQQERLGGNLFIGLAADEYREEFRRGDFLVRNLLGADPHSGVLAVGALPRPGQTVQFQCRDAEAADVELRELLQQLRTELTGRRVYGGCLCVCNGRGRHLFGVCDHDARLVQEFLGPLGVAGFFCNGEIGPVGRTNHLHGYTAALGLFVGR
jgi:small ligand-binding sensory domain FIST